MILLSLALFAQSNGDTLRWYDTTSAGWIGTGIGQYMHWAIIWPVHSSLDGRTIHSGRVHISDSTWYPPGIMRVCKGTMDIPLVVLDSGFFYAYERGFYEVLFGDTLVLQTGDLIWLWCTQRRTSSESFASIDSGPAVQGYGDLISLDGNTWHDLAEYGLNYNWVMELILTPSDVEEGPARPEEKLALIPVPGGFLITGYEGQTEIYDPAGRLVLSKEIKGKTLINPLRPGVYFVVAGKQKARVAVR